MPAGLGQGPALTAASAEERTSFFALNFVARMSISEKKFRLLLQYSTVQVYYPLLRGSRRRTSAEVKLV